MKGSPEMALSPASAELLRRVQELPREQVPAVLAALAARLLEPEPTGAVEPPPRNGGAAERWITVQQVAERLGRDARWVYRRCHGWDFTVRTGRALSFS